MSLVLRHALPDVFVDVLRGQMQRRVAVFVARFDVGAGGEQSLGRGGSIVVVRCVMQGRLTPIISGFRVGPRREQRVDRGWIADRR